MICFFLMHHSCFGIGLNNLTNVTKGFPCSFILASYSEAIIRGIFLCPNTCIQKG